MKPIFIKGQISDWESDYALSWKHQFICYENFDADEVWSWCLDNLGANMNWMVTMNGVIMRDEEDAVLFALAWC